jgi:hypothetical protein
MYKIKYLAHYYFRSKAQYSIVKFPMESLRKEFEFFEKSKRFK